MYEQKQRLLIAPRNITVEEHIINWLNSKRGLADTTYTLYEQTIKSYINKHIGSIQLQKLEKADIENLFTLLQKSGKIQKEGGLSPSMLRKVRKYLSAALDKAVEDSLLKKNPMGKIELPKMVKTVIKPLEAKEISKLIKTAKASRLYIALLLFISTGLRRGELLALQWKDICFTECTATISRQLVLLNSKPIIKSPKTEKANRIVGIPDKVIKCLQQKKKQLELNNKYNEKNLIVCQLNGKWYHPREFKTQIDKIFDDAGIEKRRIHDLRHTFATHLLSMGISINDVQEALGHADPKTTFSIYGHTLPGSQKKIASKMNSVLNI